MWKAYISGNYFFLENTSENTQFRRAKHRVEVRKESLNSKTYSFNDEYNVYAKIQFNDLVDGMGAAFADIATFETFINENTGFKSASGGSEAISYVRDSWEILNENFNDNDLGDYLNKTTEFDYSVQGRQPLLDRTNPLKLLNVSGNENAFGNFDRLTNSLGLIGTFDGSNGEIANYAICHKTGLGIYLNFAQAYNVNFVDSASNLQVATLATFSDWRMVTVKDLTHFIIDRGANEYIFSGLTIYPTFTWIMNSSSTGIGYFVRLNQTFGSSLWLATRSITSPNASIGTIAVRKHF